MPKILHTSEGLTIKKNDHNGFCVITLFYTADPAKRSEEWLREARSGLSDAKFRKEYLIDYTAMFGEKAFPEITSNTNIIVRPPHPEFPPDLPVWGGFDFGIRNPSSFHVYTIYDGVTYAIWELFEPCKNIKEFAQKLKDCPYWPRLKYVAADPHTWDVRSFDVGGNPASVAMQFWEAGITKFIKGNNDQLAWLATMRKHWASCDDPTFKIFDCCPNMIREFESAVYCSMSDKQSMVANYKETLLDHDNHSLDECKYFMNSRPAASPVKFKAPNMLNRWKN